MTASLTARASVYPDTPRGPDQVNAFIHLLMAIHSDEQSIRPDDLTLSCRALIPVSTPIPSATSAFPFCKSPLRFKIEPLPSVGGVLVL
jgi:hypothetical protein